MHVLWIIINVVIFLFLSVKALSYFDGVEEEVSRGNYQKAKWYAMLGVFYLLVDIGPTYFLLHTLGWE